MDVSTIDSALATGGRSQRGLSSLKSEDFFELLVTELKQQDPLEPAKTADMIGQVSQIRSIELSTQLTETLESLARTQRTAGASDMIGKYVRAETPLGDGTTSVVEGVVTGVHFNYDGSATLELDNGQAVASKDVTQVTTLDVIEQLLGAPEDDESTEAAAATTPPLTAKSAAASAAQPTTTGGLLPWLQLSGSFKL